jgi:tol-pal system protein YbgF
VVEEPPRRDYGRGGPLKKLLPLCLALCAACVTTKQEGDEMRKRIDALEKDLKAQKEATAADRQKLQTEQAAKLKEVQDAMDALNRAARKSGADLAVDLEKAQNDLAQNRGTLEVLQHRLDQMDQANTERDRRIDENSRFVATKQKELEHPTDKAGLYAAARKKLDAGDTGIARQFLTEFLAKYPKDELAGNAQYWLGETYYAEKRWNEAIVEFQKVLKDHRGSEKTPDALLKIGMAFQNQKDCKNALLFFDEVQQAYKSSAAAKMAREQEAQCKTPKRKAAGKPSR